jgi:hypothetical protein
MTRAGEKSRRFADRSSGDARKRDAPNALVSEPTTDATQKTPRVGAKSSRDGEKMSRLL